MISREKHLCDVVEMNGRRQKRADPQHQCADVNTVTSLHHSLLRAPSHRDELRLII